jgi:predicted site-specific integrase-resolvase
MAEESYYTPPQAARILQLSRRRVTQMLNDGQLKGEKQDNGRWKIAATVVAQFLSERSAQLAPRRGSPPARTLEELKDQVALVERRVERLADAHNRVLNHFERVEQELRKRIDKLEEELARRPR